MKKHIDGVIAKQDFNAFINALSGSYRIIGPTQIDGVVRYAPVKSPQDLKLEQGNTRLPPKAIFFPQTEPLFYFDENAKIVDMPDGRTGSNRSLNLIVGLRPCDAHAISLLDRVFCENEPRDPYYAQRRNATRIFTMVCSQAQPTCFCTAVGCGPDAATGSDVLCYGLDGRYLLKAQSRAGDEIMDAVSDLVSLVTKNDIEEARAMVAKVTSTIKNDISIYEMQTKLENFNSSCWECLYDKCLGCGICTYLCPTCHCFDISDEVVRSNGRRVRAWDSCQFPLFTLHASGHNPRPSRKERVRQRIMHKFNYARKYYDLLFCVGCGRCILHCPVNMDIRKIIQQIAEAP